MTGEAHARTGRPFGALVIAREVVRKILNRPHPAEFMLTHKKATVDMWRIFRLGDRFVGKPRDVSLKNRGNEQVVARGGEQVVEGSRMVPHAPAGT